MSVAHRRRRIVPLTPQLVRFVEAFGVMWSIYGLPRGTGRIFGLLLVAGEPLSPKEITSILHLSRSSVSMDMRGLLNLGVVERVRVPGNRTSYYVFSPHAWERALMVRRQEANRYRELAEQTAGELPVGHPGRRRLSELREWADIFAAGIDHMRDQWVGRRRGEAAGGRR